MVLDDKGAIAAALSGADGSGVLWPFTGTAPRGWNRAVDDERSRMIEAETMAIDRRRNPYEDSVIKDRDTPIPITNIQLKCGACNEPINSDETHDSCRFRAFGAAEIKIEFADIVSEGYVGVMISRSTSVCESEGAFTPWAKFKIDSEIFDGLRGISNGHRCESVHYHEGDRVRCQRDRAHDETMHMHTQRAGTVNECVWVWPDSEAERGPVDVPRTHDDMRSVVDEFCKPAEPVKLEQGATYLMIMHVEETSRGFEKSAQRWADSLAQFAGCAITSVVLDKGARIEFVKIGEAFNRACQMVMLQHFIELIEMALRVNHR